MAGKTRRTHGGTIRKLPSGRWQVRVLDRATGRHVAVGTFPTKADANAALTRAVADQAAGRWASPARGRGTLAGYAAGWLDDHPGLAPRTRDRYDQLLRIHVLPHLGATRLAALTTQQIRRWHATVQRTSPSTAAKAYRLLRTILNTAVDDGLIGVNPCQVKGAGVERHDERPVATVAEVAQLADAVDPRYRMLVLLAAWTGLRFGELAALERDDVDLDAGTVTVTKQRLTLDDGRTLTTGPKSAAGRRTVTVPPPLVAQLAAHIDRHAGDRLVFVDAHGRPLQRRTWGKRWAAARTEVGRPDLRFHDLRHTGNTLAAATGASTKELMARMGHASPRVALVYQHATRDRDQAIARALGELIDGG